MCARLRHSRICMDCCDVSWQYRSVCDILRRLLRNIHLGCSHDGSCLAVSRHQCPRSTDRYDHNPLRRRATYWITCRRCHRCTRLARDPDIHRRYADSIHHCRGGIACHEAGLGHSWKMLSWLDFLAFAVIRNTSITSTSVYLVIISHHY